MNKLDQYVIELHNIARELDGRWGDHGGIVENIRACADRLSALIPPAPTITEVGCAFCKWNGNINDCETNDWGENSCPECGESVELKHEY